LRYGTFSLQIIQSRLKINRRFGRTCSLYLQGRRTRQARHLREVGTKQTYLLPALCWLTLRPWRWRLYVAPKCRTLPELYRLKTHWNVLFIVTTVRSSDPMTGFFLMLVIWNNLY
jgi:hypothetical protein